jgi:hypothetical protein
MSSSRRKTKQMKRQKRHVRKTSFCPAGYQMKRTKKTAKVRKETQTLDFMMFITRGETKRQSGG